MKNNDNNNEFLFGKTNYKILIVGIVLIALGFILMSGGGSDDPNVFNEEIFSLRALRLCGDLICTGSDVFHQIGLVRLGASEHPYIAQANVL